MKIKTLMTIKKALEKTGERKNMPKVLQKQMLLQRGKEKATHARKQDPFTGLSSSCDQDIQRNKL